MENKQTEIISAMSLLVDKYKNKYRWSLEHIKKLQSKIKRQRKENYNLGIAHVREILLYQKLLSLYTKEQRRSLILYWLLLLETSTILLYFLFNIIW